MMGEGAEFDCSRKGAKLPLASLGLVTEARNPLSQTGTPPFPFSAAALKRETGHQKALCTQLDPPIGGANSGPAGAEGGRSRGSP